MRIIKTKAPIDVEYLQEYFSTEEPSIIFEIMYYDSDIKGKVLLNYLSNLDIKSKINFYQTSQEEKAEMLREYMLSPNLIDCEELEHALTYIVLKYNNCNVDDLYSLSLLTLENTEKFISENIDTLRNITDFIESLPLVSMSYVPALKDTVEVELKNYEIMEDENILGKNVINLLNNFLTFQLYEKSGARKRYFKHFSEEYIFDGKNLYSWMLEKDVPLLVFVQGIASGVQPS